MITNTMFIKTPLFILFSLISFLCYGQDPAFSQYFANPLYTNPAYAGTGKIDLKETNATRLNLSYRNQWPSLKGTYQTLNLSYDRDFTSLKGGLGGMITRDVAGAGLITTNNINVIYNYKIPVNEKFIIRTAIQPGFVSKSIDFNRLITANQIDPVQGFVYQPFGPIPESNVSFFNLGVGAIGYAKNYHIGFAVHNVLEPNQSFYGSSEGILPRRYTLHAGGKINLLKQVKFQTFISPYMLYMKQGPFNQLTPQVTINTGRVITGFGMRQTLGTFGNADAVIGLLGYRSANFKILYSYDRTVSSARPAAAGSHELSLNYYFSNKRNAADYSGLSPDYL